MKSKPCSMFLLRYGMRESIALTLGVFTCALFSVLPAVSQEDPTTYPVAPEPLVKPEPKPADPVAKPAEPAEPGKVGDAPSASSTLTQSAILNPVNQVQNESPAAFLQRYFIAKQMAKTPMDLAAFFEPHKFDLPPEAAKNPAQLKDAMKMLEAFFGLEKLSTPRTAVVTSTTPQGNNVVLTTKTVEMGPLSATNKVTYIGKYVLKKGATSWIIVNEYSTTDDGKGFKSSSGADPKSKPPVRTARDVYQDAVSTALDKVWKPDDKSRGNVEAVLMNTPTGAFKIINVTDKNGSAEAESAVKQMLSRLVLPGLPASVDTPCINLQLSWSPDKLPLRCTQYTKESWVESQPVLHGSNGQVITTVAWANEGKKDTFKQQVFGGNLEGQTVRFTKATIELDENGYEIKFRPSQSQDYPCVALFLRTREDLANKTLYIPLPPSKGRFGDLEGTTFYRHTGHMSSGVSDGIGGRIQFMHWKDGKLGGYLTLRVASGSIKASTLSGYFYAEQKNNLKQSLPVW